MTEQGIDVAWPQGARYNWRQWAGRIAFGMCKVSEGTGLVDVGFADNWDAMWSLRPDHRLPRFGYHFFRAAEDPIAQARHFVSTVKAHGMLAGDNLVADFESTDPGDGLNDHVQPRVFAERGTAFLREVNELAPGHRVLPYANPSFIRAGNCAGMGSWYLWIADYGVKQPQIPVPWDRWTFWQSGDTPVDTDIYNGDDASLLAFTRMPDRR